MKRLIIPSAILAVLISCSVYKKIDLWSISTGMSKSEVIKTLKKRPDNLIAAKRYPSGKLEVVQYSRREPWMDQLVERYWLYFFNDTLIQWGRPGDWQREADSLIEVRYR